jgi:hypothetical protein
MRTLFLNSNALRNEMRSVTKAAQTPIVVVYIHMLTAT